MRNLKILFLISLFAILRFEGFSQTPGQWTCMNLVTGDINGHWGIKGTPDPANFPPLANECGFWTDTTGNFWIYVGGCNGGGGCKLYGDLWRYNPNTLEWTWMNGTGIRNQPPVFGIQGVEADTCTPGIRFNGMSTWVDGNNNLWLFGGAGTMIGNDLWRYNITTNRWAFMGGTYGAGYTYSYGTRGVMSPSNLPPDRMLSYSTWYENNNLWLYSGDGAKVYDDLWKYNIPAGQWTWVKGDTFYHPPVYGSRCIEDPANSPGYRFGSGKWIDNNNNLWLFGGWDFGNGNNKFLNDVWKYNITTNNWTWVAGPDTANGDAVYGTKCSSSENNVPPPVYDAMCWSDSLGNFYTMGGNSNGGTAKEYNSLWHYNIKTCEWTWLKGANSGSQTDNYGTRRVSALSNTPGSIWASCGFKDKKGYLWLYNAGSGGGNADMWRYVPNPSCPLIINPNPLIVNLGNDTILCNVSNYTLDAKNSGSTYNWSTGATTKTINITTTGSYAVTVFNCPNFDRDTILVTFSSCDLSLGNDTILCAGNSLTLDAKNTGSTYYWSTDVTTQTITVNSTGAYSVTVTTGSYTDRDSILVTVYPQPNVNLGNDIVSCTGSTVTLDAKNTGSTYIWSTGAATKTIAVTTAGAYAVTVSNGPCSDRDTIQVSFDPQLTVTLGNDTTLCNSNPLTLDAKYQGSTYIWSNNAITQTIDVVSSNTYSVTVTNGACSGTDNIQVTFSPQPNVNLGNDTTLCNGNTLTLNAKNTGSTYQWSTGAASKTIVVNTIGTYSVTVYNGLCSDRDTIIISAGILPVVDIGKDTTLCAGNILTLDAGNPGKTYKWSTNEVSQTINVSTSNTYYVTVSDNGCINIDTIVVSFIAVPIVNLGIDKTICGSDPIELDANNTGCTYKWSLGETTQKITVSSSGTYSVTVTNSPCSASDKIAITYVPFPTVDAGRDTAISNYGSVQLNASGGSHYSWSPATGLSETDIYDPLATPRSTTTYTVTVTDNNGCTATDQMTVTVYDIDCGEVYVPTAFSPNGDGKNDILKVHGKCIKSMNFIIYDRLGQKVFESKDQATGWDGKYKGKILEDAAFRYFLKATMLDNSKIEQHGEINLLR